MTGQKTNTKHMDKTREKNKKPHTNQHKYNSFTQILPMYSKPVSYTHLDVYKRQ